MAESRFWRAIAVTLVTGVFYLAHGLHDSGSQVPSLIGEVQAGDVATAVGGGSTSAKIITSSDDGRTIHVWSTSTTGNSVKFLGTFSAKRD